MKPDQRSAGPALRSRRIDSSGGGFGGVWVGEKCLENFLPLQVGDVPATWADIEALQQDVGYTPATPVEEGIAQFVKWYKEYYAN